MRAKRWWSRLILDHSKLHNFLNIEEYRWKENIKDQNMVEVKSNDYIKSNRMEVN